MGIPLSDRICLQGTRPAMKRFYRQGPLTIVFGMMDQTQRTIRPLRLQGENPLDLVPLAVE